MAFSVAAIPPESISHRCMGGPDLNYLYATDHVDPIDPPFLDSSDTENKLSCNNNNNNGGKRTEKKNGRDNVKAKKPIKRGRKKDKRSLRGQTLYLGGEEGPNSKIYCIPGHAERVLVIDTKTDEVYPIGPVLDGKFKWLRGIVIGNIIYGLPCHADSILRIDTQRDHVSTIDIPYEDFFDNGTDPSSGAEPPAFQERHRDWKYHGGAVSPHDGCIYAIPQSAKRVLRIDPATEACSFVGPEYEGRCKWYGGVVGKTDGAIYGIPQNAEGVLRIDASGVVSASCANSPAATPESRVLVTTHGDFPLGGHKWHGAAASADGTIVSVPANADNVLCIVPALSPAHPSPQSRPAVPEPTLYLLSGQTPSDISTGRHRSDSKYKYLGSMQGTDGRVYCFPSGSERVLQVDTVNRVARSVGPNLRDKGLERLFQNKWQNGLTTYQEGCVYAIPLAAETVLRIRTGGSSPNTLQNDNEDDTTDVEVTTWALPLPNTTLAKWEGGVLAKNGVMYCMPNNHKAVLQIVPPCVPSRDDLLNKKKERQREREKENLMRKQQQEKEEKEKSQETEKEGGKDKNGKITPSPNNSETSQISDKSHDPDNMTPDNTPFKYKTGIATLRSSAHRVKYSLTHRKHDPNPVGNDGNSTNTTFLPSELCREDTLSYSTEDFDFHGVVVDMLQQCDQDLIGKFRTEDEIHQLESSIQTIAIENSDPNGAPRDKITLTGVSQATDANINHSSPSLENFVVPPKSLTRKCQKGKIERAQKYLSEMVATNTTFMALFDRFLETVVLPHFRYRLQKAGVIQTGDDAQPVTFYYQRPPTMRIQPGPARALVRGHDDAEYGHQNGELNFWLPLTSPRRTGVDIWVESAKGEKDFHPLGAEYGEVVSFHGSSCQHYVNANHSRWTRVSLDFRVGVEGFFDPSWQMIGTTDDHSRRKVTL